MAIHIDTIAHLLNSSAAVTRARNREAAAANAVIAAKNRCAGVRFPDAHRRRKRVI
jgi:hypothetical protein